MNSPQKRQSKAQTRVVVKEVSILKSFFSNAHILWGVAVVTVSTAAVVFGYVQLPTKVKAQEEQIVKVDEKVAVVDKKVDTTNADLNKFVAVSIANQAAQRELNVVQQQAIQQQIQLSVQLSNKDKQEKKR